MRMRLVDNNGKTLWEDESNLPVPSLNDQILIMGQAHWVTDVTPSYEDGIAVMVLEVTTDVGGDSIIF